MMSAFNTSTRREDISVRLKSQNLRSAKEQTRQLEEESRKMEERLRELKMAMSREKEHRERQGAGFWRTGQTGNLHSYAHDVLEAKPPKQHRQDKSKSGSAKVKVLKDEPICVPNRSKAPGTIGYIASKRVSPKDKRKGPPCGQCEDRGASVSCAQCGEDYCAGCFAAFHLKGALKKHRSIPIQANTPRSCHTPRLTSPISSRDPVTSHLPAEAESCTAVVLRNGGGNRNSPEGASGSFNGPSLLAGKYDENGSAASFQEALKAWRGGDEAQTTTTRSSAKAAIKPRTSPVTRPNPSSGHSHVKPAVVSVEHSTSTVDVGGDNSVAVTFQEHGISYAERLLLKRHRKTDVGHLPDGCPSELSDDQWDEYNQPHTGRGSFYDQEGNLDTGTGHVNFQTLYDAVCTSGAPSRAGADSGLSVIELPDYFPVVNGGETPGRCHIEEVENAPGDGFYRGTSKPAPSRMAFTEERVDAASAGIPPFDMRVPLRGLNSDTSVTMPPSGHKRKGSKSAKLPYVTEPESDHEGHSSTNHHHSQPPQHPDPTPDDSNDLVTKTASSKSNSKRPSTAKSRPQSRARPKSTARPKSRTASRAGSRMASRTSMYGEGHLTKAPSSSLHAVAQMELSAPDIVSANNLASLSGFFLAGVKRAPQEREIIPTSAKEMSKENQYKISNRLYQMAPRSWRPDTSLGEMVPTSDVRVEGGSEEVTLSYTYSGQVTGSPVHIQTGPVTVSLSDNYPVRPPSRPKSRAPLSSRPHRLHSPTVHQEVGRPLTGGGQTDSGRLSRAIVVEGEDLSRYDEDTEASCMEQAEEDGETLHQLEWELASQTGRVTEDGKLSRLDLLTPEGLEEGAMSEEELTDRLTQLTTPGPGYDIDVQLREEELMDDFEEMERLIIDEEDVKRLH